jgi:hypothetical protein
MNELEQLKHRLAMIKDDLDVIRSFIYSEQLDKTFFERPSKTSDECWTNLNNIELLRATCLPMNLCLGNYIQRQPDDGFNSRNAYGRRCQSKLT